MQAKYNWVYHSHEVYHKGIYDHSKAITAVLELMGSLQC